MERNAIAHRHFPTHPFNGYRPYCRQFISGSCRFGPSCHFSHELPVLPSVQICRYFQKGLCWFGDRCRFQHIPHPDNVASASRRGSAPLVRSPAWSGPALPGRRGSEPALLQFPGTQVWGRRGSEPLVPSVVHGVVSLQPSYEHLTTGIAEEEEQVAPWSVVPNGALHDHSPATSSVVASSPLVAQEGATSAIAEEKPQEPSTEKVTTTTSSQLELAQGGAAALVDNTQPEEVYQQSKDVACGICMDKVYEKPSPQDRRFGILPNCSHAFCLGCIVTWRKTKDFQEEVIKACPQCRVKSSFYIPSKYWVSEGESKQSLITAFKEKTSKIRCTFFMRHGCCPFKTECIYRHDLPNGYQPRRRRSSPMHYSDTLEDLDSDDLQLLHCFIALTLLESDDMLDDDDNDYFLYLENDYDEL